MNLISLGWSEQLEADRSQAATVARVIAVHRSHFRAILEQGEMDLFFSGSLDLVPAVGDWVEISQPYVSEKGHLAALVQRVLPRKSKISRMRAGSHAVEQVIAANIDRVFIVTSANLDFNISRLQRYLLLVNEGGACPVLVVSKIDLDPHYEEKMSEISQKLDSTIPLIATSILEGIGLEEMRRLMPVGSTSVFVGSSGVGKSSLVNYFLSEDRQAVREISEGKDRGKHTTTSRELFFIPNGGMIIDTPGVRSVEVFGEEESLAETFSHIDELISQCKFSDCGHNNEPGCAIKSALSSGALIGKEWDNYLKLLLEMAHTRRKSNKAEVSNSKKRWKKINIEHRQRKKEK